MMASLFKDPRGQLTIQFTDEAGKRRWIRLPKKLNMSKHGEKLAADIKDAVERIVDARRAKRPMDRETFKWICSLDDRLYAKLANAALVEPREGHKPPPAPKATTLGELASAYIAACKHHKPTTKLTIIQTKKALVKIFGDDRAIDTITVADARAWVNGLKAKGAKANKTGDGYATATVSTFVKKARAIFRHAVDSRKLTENPFASIKAGSQKNKARQEFISQETIDRVIDAANHPEWKLIIALARYGGLRTPSETFRLRITDVDWENGWMTVVSPKQEHLDGGGIRRVPIFDKLRPYLMQAADFAFVGAVYFINRYRGDNLRTQFQRIIRKAGVKPWGRLFHNLRSFRQTELTAALPMHVACAIMGNTPEVATDHYLQVRDADIANVAGIDAVAAPAKAQQSAQQINPETDGKRLYPIPVPTENTVNSLDFPYGTNDYQEKQYPRQESNLIPDLRRVVCDPPHPEDANIPARIRTEIRTSEESDVAP